MTQLEPMEARRRRRGDGDAVSFVTKLGAAKHALALAEEVPDLTDLLDNAEAIRAAAKAKHISAPGVNAWTRFVIDIERKGWARIEEMRRSNELGKKGGDPKSKPRTLALKDIIERNPNQTASEWALLAKLTEFQLDEMERIANEEDRLLTRAELLKLAKMATPKGAKEEKEDDIFQSPEDLKAIAAARLLASEVDFDIQIDDDAEVTHTDREAWVAAWIRVKNPLAQSDLED